MGFIAGVGSFTGDRQQPSLEIRMHRRDMEPLEDVRRVLGGRIFGPYTHGGRPLYVYMLRGRELKDAIPTIQQHLPNSWKRVQFLGWLEKYREHFNRPEPSQALIDRVHRLLPARG